MVPAIPDEHTIQLWWHYEQVAMHFNGLILQYRIQVLAAIGALGTAAVLFFEKKGETQPNTNTHLMRALLITGLLCVFTSAVTFDLFYYNMLLQGAVDAIVRFEDTHRGIYLSKCISANFSKFPCSADHLPWNPGLEFDREFIWLRFLFAYGIIFVPLLALTIYYWRNYIKNRRSSISSR